MPIDIDFVFEDVASKVTGDRRALVGFNVRKLDSVLERFPSDYDMIHVLARSFYNEVRSLSRRSFSA